MGRRLMRCSFATDRALDPHLDLGVCHDEHDNVLALEANWWHDNPMTQMGVAKEYDPVRQTAAFQELQILAYVPEGPEGRMIRQRIAVVEDIVKCGIFSALVGVAQKTPPLSHPTLPNAAFYEIREGPWTVQAFRCPAVPTGERYQILLGATHRKLLSRPGDGRWPDAAGRS